MAAEVPAWGAATVPAPDPHGAEDCGGTCAGCQVKAAGARAIAAAVDVDYDNLPAVEQGHMRHLAGHVYTAMSEAILAVPGIKSFTAGTLTADGTVEATQ